MSNRGVNRSTIFPLPSSPHCAPSTARFIIGLRFYSQRHREQQMVAAVVRVATLVRRISRYHMRAVMVCLAEARRDRVVSETTCRRSSRESRAIEGARSKRRERARSQEKNIFVFD